MEGGMGVSAHASNRYSKTSPSKTLKPSALKGGKGVSAHTSNRYFNAQILKTLKPSAWKEVKVLVHTHLTDIPLLHHKTH